MPETKKFYLTTPIYYVNARPHIGHAYSTIVADVLARRHRLLGDETYFLTGTDEHGQKIERSAAAAGVPPQQFADRVSKTFSDLWKRMGITNDQFIRTTSEKHKVGVQKLFRTIYENGKHLENPYIYLDTYTGSYCVSDEAFVDAPVGTPCPDCGRLLEEVTEENFFFRLSAFQEQLIDLIESNELVITPDSSRNEVLNFIRGNWQAELYQNIPTAKTQLSERGLPSARPEDVTRYIGEPNSGLHGKAKPTKLAFYVPGALKDLSISRSSFTWGIPVPEDIQKAEEATQKHVIYVWLDALANYITALGYGSSDETLLQEFWQADGEDSPLHLVGKEITRFHCVYWPAFLLAADLPLPKQIKANGWLLFDNSKMSKSKGNVVRTETILDAFGTLCPPNLTGQEPSAHDRDLFAADVLRYYLLREIPFGQDGSFSFESLVSRYNADLANGYGNLVSRTLTMIQQYGHFVEPDPNFVQKIIEHFAGDEEVKSARQKLKSQLREAELSFFQLAKLTELTGTIEDNALTRLCENAAGLVKYTDAVLSMTTPWKMLRNAAAHGLVIDSSTSFAIAMESLQAILHHCAESIRIITALLYPVLPYATARVWAQLGLGDIEQDAREGKLANLHWGGLEPGTKLGPQSTLFPSIKKQDIPAFVQRMIDMENPTPETPATAAPDAAPRTSSLPEPSGTLTVGGSAAHTTGADASIVQTPPSVTTAPADAPTESTPQIGIDDFAKIDLRVAQIVLAERIPKADKLLRLEVDLGPMGKRQILSGIAEFYTPEELTGRRIVVIANLAPRKMRGLESHGMLLAASDGDHGKPHLATCGDEIALGSRLK